MAFHHLRHLRNFAEFSLFALCSRGNSRQFLDCSLTASGVSLGLSRILLRLGQYISLGLFTAYNLVRCECAISALLL